MTISSPSGYLLLVMVKFRFNYGWYFDFFCDYAILSNFGNLMSPPKINFLISWDEFSSCCHWF